MGGAPREDEQVVTVTDDLVRRLLEDQFPELANEDIGRHYEVPGHVSVRVGDRLGAHLPTRKATSDAIARSFDLVTAAAPGWSFPTSTALFLGRPTDYYPFAWDIVTWHPATSAAVVPLTQRAAVPLARALAEIHKPAPDGAPTSPRTGRTLDSVAEEFQLLMGRAHDLTGPRGERLELAAYEDEFAAGLSAPIDEPLVWTHGNMNPHSVLSDQGAFAGVCDWFNFGAGDPAIELASASLLLPEVTHDEARGYYLPMSPNTRARTRAYRRLIILRALFSGNAFFSRLAWMRVREMAAEVRQP